MICLCLHLFCCFRMSFYSFYVSSYLTLVFLAHLALWEILKDVLYLRLIQAHLPEVLDVAVRHVLETHWKALWTLWVARGLSPVWRGAVAYGSRSHWLRVLLEVLLDRIVSHHLRLLHRHQLWWESHVRLHHVVLLWIWRGEARDRGSRNLMPEHGWRLALHSLHSTVLSLVVLSRLTLLLAGHTLEQSCLMCLLSLVLQQNILVIWVHLAHRREVREIASGVLTERWERHHRIRQAVHVAMLQRLLFVKLLKSLTLDHLREASWNTIEVHALGRLESSLVQSTTVSSSPWLLSSDARSLVAILPSSHCLLLCVLMVGPWIIFENLTRGHF